MSVILNAPAVFRFTAPACPDRHLREDEALRATVANTAAQDAGRILADRITELIHRVGMPNGLRSIGYSVDDIPALVAGTLPQHRVTKLSPRSRRQEELGRLFEEALVAW